MTLPSHPENPFIYTYVMNREGKFLPTPNSLSNDPVVLLSKEGSRKKGCVDSEQTLVKELIVKNDSARLSLQKLGLLNV